MYMAWYLKKPNGYLKFLQRSPEIYAAVGIFLIRSKRLFTFCLVLRSIFINYRYDGLVARASASQSVDLGFDSLVESYEKTKNWYSLLPCLVLSTKGIVWRTRWQTLLLCTLNGMRPSSPSRQMAGPSSLFVVVAPSKTED